MKKATSFVAVFLVLLAPLQPLHAQSAPGTRVGLRCVRDSRSGNTTSWQGGGGHASGSRTVNQTGSGAQSTRQAQTQGGASREVTRDVNTEDRTVDRNSTVTTAQGETATRERTTEAQGGYATIEGKREDEHRARGRGRGGGRPQRTTVNPRSRAASTPSTPARMPAPRRAIPTVDILRPRSAPTGGRSRRRFLPVTASPTTTAARTTPTAGPTTGRTRTTAFRTTTRCRRRTTPITTSPRSAP